MFFGKSKTVFLSQNAEERGNIHGCGKRKKHLRGDALFRSQHSGISYGGEQLLLSSPTAANSCRRKHKQQQLQSWCGRVPSQPTRLSSSLSNTTSSISHQPSYRTWEKSSLQWPLLHPQNLIPNSTKSDRASIVGEAIDYIKELLRTIEEFKMLLEKKKLEEFRSMKKAKTDGEEY